MKKNRDTSSARVAIVALTLCFLAACSPDSSKNSASTAAPSASTETVTAQTSAPTASTTQANAGCTRGEPEPILAAGSEFKRVGEEGTETFVTPNGTDWSIRQFGCDHYAVEFTLTTTEKLPLASDLPAWTTQQFESLKVAESSQPIVAAISNGIKEAASSLGQAAQLSETETLTISKPESTGTKVVVLYDVAI